jgi:cytochrome bd-type quinol oxidase subunit 2
MFKALRKNIVSLFAAFTLAAIPVAVPVAVHAADNIQNCLAGGTNLNIDTTGACPDTTQTTQTGAGRINSMIKIIVNIFSAIVGVIAVIMIIYGGVKYITSGGESGNISSAKNTIVYAVIGLVVVALAQFIVQFVLDKVNSPNGGTA